MVSDEIIGQGGEAWIGLRFYARTIHNTSCTRRIIPTWLFSTIVFSFIFSKVHVGRKLLRTDTIPISHPDTMQETAQSVTSPTNY